MKSDPVKETDERLNIRPVDDIRRAILVVLAERYERSLTTTDVFKLVVDKLGHLVSRDKIYTWLWGMQHNKEIDGWRRGNGRWRWVAKDDEKDVS
jgi:hypothetical protein